MTRTFLLLAGVALLAGGCTDVASRDGPQIAITVPSAYKLDTAHRRADRYCERHYDTKAELSRTENLGHSSVAYFECR